MATDVISTLDMQAKWDEAFARLEKAEAVYEEIKQASEPLYDLMANFEARHGLVAPGCERDGTFQYFEKRKALFEQNPHYAVPDAVADRLEALVEVICDIQTELMNLPSPDYPALAWKLKHTSGACWEDHYIAQMNADIDRLMVEA